jgi:hypothetical protein
MAAFRGTPRRPASVRNPNRNTDQQGQPHWVGRGPDMMMAMPTRLTATPIQSVAVGRMPSTVHSQRMATPM